ncbi:MAG: IclR family transcriptional regulator [Firmicutes bacterium]|jgi:DNA-binding IclR family transcriptional regulator|nr:IclR family transcriptional regulator [Bacillota bacterium]HQD39140.1 IclR family transcriptional regulator [Bacillota bacterium]
MTKRKPAKPIQTLDRSLAILETLAQVGKPMSLSEVAEKVGLDRSTVYRFLGAMELRNLVQQDENNRYTLGLKMVELGYAALEEMDLRQIARPVLQQLMESCNETANLSVLVGTEVMYIDQVESSNMIKMFARIGSRAPAYATGAGKALLAFLPPDELEEILGKIKFRQYTCRTITGPELFRSSLSQIRLQGYALDFGELEEGVHCAAVPIFDWRGYPVAALSISGPNSRMTEEFINERVTKVLVEAAREVSAKLGYNRESAMGL